MDFESSFIHCILTSDIKGLENLCIDKDSVNDIFITKINQRDNDSIGVQCPNYPTPLIFSIYHKKYDVVEFLLSLGADVNVSLYNGWCSIHYAIALNQPTIVKLLISHDKNLINKTTRFGATPLHFAVNVSSTECLFLLLQNGANVNQVNDNGNTALHLSTACFNKDIVKMLCAYGADKSIRNKDRKTALDIAKDRGDQVAVDIISTQKKDMKLFESLAERKGDVNDITEQSEAADLEKSLQDKILLLAQRISKLEAKNGL